MERNDFISGDAYYRYKFERESKNEEIQRLRTKKMDASSFSFRFLSGLEKKDYPVDIWNDLQQDADVDVHTVRIGDFFVYATFDYAGKHARVTLGDMWQQRHNNYGDGYSNIIIHPDGRVSTNWR